VAALTSVFFDTSVLVAGLIEIGEIGEHAQRIMTAVAENRVRHPETAWHCCLEFYAVSTRLPAELRLAPADALRLVEEEILGRFRVRQLPETSRLSFLRDAVRDDVVGGRVYDAHIAEIARRARAKTVVTDNRRHFTTLLRHGVRVLGTEDFSHELGR
jgi:predicted nucleic acid-binding protein